MFGQRQLCFEAYLKQSMYELLLTLVLDKFYTSVYYDSMSKVFFCDYGGTKIVLKLVGWRIFCLLLESGLDSPLAIGYMHKNLQGRVALAKIESL